MIKLNIIITANITYSFWRSKSIV